MTSCPYGYRIVGATWERRQLVDAGAAVLGYASCDNRAEPGREAYLSAFQFGAQFRQLLDTTGSTAGYTGVCWAPWLWFDIDRADALDGALSDARRLAAYLLQRFASLDDDDLLAFYSGSKGFHVGLPTALWRPDASTLFHQAARRCCERLAAAAGVVIDSGIYDKVRAFRAPNSRHAKTGRFKRRLSHDELMGLSLDAILHLAQQPEPFDLPAPAATDDQAAQDWQAAVQLVEKESEGNEQRRAAAANGTPTLNRSFFNFLRDGALEGDRHRLLFSAAANLAEFGCSFALANALLSEAALDCGLSPSDVRRQIACGLARGAKGQGPPAVSPASSPPIAAAPPGPAALQAQLAALWASAAPVPASSSSDSSSPSEPPTDAPDYGDAWEPPGSQIGPAARVTPPAAAKVHFNDDDGRPCPPARATMWTWEGAPSWYHVADHPISLSTSAEGQR
jgi:hypothetical protein